MKSQISKRSGGMIKTIYYHGIFITHAGDICIHVGGIICIQGWGLISIQVEGIICHV